ncbi:MAG: hypothetical protein ACI8TQ_002884 [Planctomycetota bacterium]|jgi:hypothetical protein
MKFASSIALYILLFSATVGIASCKTVDGESGDSTKPAVLTPIGDKPVVLIFIDTDCPIANSYVPEINRIYNEYSARDVKLTLVHVYPHLTPEDEAKHALEYSLAPPRVIDRQHKLIRLAEATTTPEVVVFDSTGSVAYRGRIDNQYSDYGDRRQTVSEHYLRDALDSILAGTPVAIEQTAPLGCIIETL